MCKKGLQFESEIVVEDKERVRLWRKVVASSSIAENSFAVGVHVERCLHVTCLPVYPFSQAQVLRCGPRRSYSECPLRLEFGTRVSKVSFEHLAAMLGKVCYGNGGI